MRRSVSFKELEEGDEFWFHPSHSPSVKCTKTEEWHDPWDRRWYNARRGSSPIFVEPGASVYIETETKRGE